MYIHIHTSIFIDKFRNLACKIHKLVNNIKFIVSVQPLHCYLCTLNVANALRENAIDEIIRFCSEQ